MTPKTQHLELQNAWRAIAEYGNAVGDLLVGASREIDETSDDDDDDDDDDDHDDDWMKELFDRGDASLGREDVIAERHSSELWEQGLWHGEGDLARNQLARVLTNLRRTFDERESSGRPGRDLEEQLLRIDELLRDFDGAAEVESQFDAAIDAARLIDDVARHSLYVFKSATPTSNGLFRPIDGLFLPGQLVGSASEVISRLRSDPSRMFSMNPYQFEEVVAELFAANGFDVQLTARARDKGRDVIAIFARMGIADKYVIEFRSGKAPRERFRSPAMPIRCTGLRSNRPLAGYAPFHTRFHRRLRHPSVVRGADVG